MSALARLAPESVGYGGGDREPARGRNKAAYGGLHFGLGANAQIPSGVVAADPQSPLRIAPFRRRRNHMSCCPHSKVRQHCPLRTRLEPRARTLPRERDQTVISDRSLNTFVPSRSPGAGFGTEISARTRTLVSHGRTSNTLTRSPSVKRRYVSVAFDCHRSRFAPFAIRASYAVVMAANRSRKA
jgi:hypothetical protein